MAITKKKANFLRFFLTCIRAQPLSCVMMLQSLTSLPTDIFLFEEMQSHVSYWERMPTAHRQTHSLTLGLFSRIHNWSERRINKRKSLDFFFFFSAHAKPKTIKIPCNKVFSPLIWPNKPQENDDNTNNDSQFTHSWAEREKKSNSTSIDLLLCACLCVLFFASFFSSHKNMFSKPVHCLNNAFVLEPHFFHLFYIYYFLDDTCSGLVLSPSSVYMIICIELTDHRTFTFSISFSWTRSFRSIFYSLIHKNVTTTYHLIAFHADHSPRKCTFLCQFSSG